MAYGKIKADKIVYDNSGSDVEVNVSALAGAGSTAPTNDPAFTGTPTAPTAAQGTNTTQIATTAFVNAEIAADTAGNAPIASPTFTGTPAGPTAAQGTNTTQLATTAFVKTEITADIAGKADIASPTFTGTPSGPTAAGGTNTTQLATTAFVLGETAQADPSAWTSSSSSVTAAVNTRYLIDTTSAALTLTLPASATVGQFVTIGDKANKFLTNNLTVARNGHAIAGSSSNLICNVNGVVLTLTYVGGSVGWLVS